MTDHEVKWLERVMDVMLVEGSSSRQIAQLYIQMPSRWKVEFRAFDAGGAPCRILAFAVGKLIDEISLAFSVA